MKRKTWSLLALLFAAFALLAGCGGDDGDDTAATDRTEATDGTDETDATDETDDETDEETDDETDEETDDETDDETDATDALPAPDPAGDPCTVFTAAEFNAATGETFSEGEPEPDGLSCTYASSEGSVVVVYWAINDISNEERDCSPGTVQEIQLHDAGIVCEIDEGGLTLTVVGAQIGDEVLALIGEPAPGGATDEQVVDAFTTLLESKG